ncbi:MAG: hypothetical protein ACT4R6_13480 [Gemmatimonadaceae bacterium]
MKSLVCGAVLAGTLAFTPAPAHAQLRGMRFSVSAIGDSTVEFRTGATRWIRPGMLGVAVDPRRRDALVARFRVIAVQEAGATAVITGQTTALSLEHVVVLEEPGRRAYRSPPFWLGIVIGGALGLFVALAQ